MEDTAGAAGSGSSLPPEVTMASTAQRGQKRGAPDEDDAAGDGAARCSRRRAGFDNVAEEAEEFVDDNVEEDELDEADDGAPPSPQLFEFLRVHPGAAADAGGGAAAGREPVVDVTLRLGVGPVAGEYPGGTVDTTLSLRLGSAAAAPGGDDGRRFQSPGEPATSATLGGAASNAEADIDEGLVRDSTVAALFHCPTSEDEEDFFPAANDFAMACSAATAAAGGPVGFAADDDDEAGRSSSGLDLNQPCPSELPDGAPDPSDVPVLDTVAAVDDADLAAHVDERGVATATAVEQRRRSSTSFIDFCCGPVHEVRAPGVLTADSS